MNLNVQFDKRDNPIYDLLMDIATEEFSHLEIVGANQIAKADLIIADVRGKNPNVMYEVGYALALNKPTILITRNEGDIPFDFKHSQNIHHLMK